MRIHVYFNAKTLLQNNLLKLNFIKVDTFALNRNSHHAFPYALKASSKLKIFIVNNKVGTLYSAFSNKNVYILGLD